MPSQEQSLHAAWIRRLRFHPACCPAVRNAERIPYTNQLAWTGNHQSIGALKFGRCQPDCLFHSPSLHSRTGNFIGDDFGIRRSLKGGPGSGKLFPQFFCMNQISIMGQRQRPFYIVQYKRLCIIYCNCSGCRIADISDSKIPL